MESAPVQQGLIKTVETIVKPVKEHAQAVLALQQLIVLVVKRLECHRLVEFVLGLFVLQDVVLAWELGIINVQLVKMVICF